MGPNYNFNRKMDVRKFGNDRADKTPSVHATVNQGKCVGDDIRQSLTLSYVYASDLKCPFQQSNAFSYKDLSESYDFVTFTRPFFPSGKNRPDLNP
jgi:hypothetical protein